MPAKSLTQKQLLEQLQAQVSILVHQQEQLQDRTGLLEHAQIENGKQILAIRGFMEEQKNSAQERTELLTITSDNTKMLVDLMVGNPKLKNKGMYEEFTETKKDVESLKAGRAVIVGVFSALVAGAAFFKDYIGKLFK